MKKTQILLTFLVLTLFAACGGGDEGGQPFHPNPLSTLDADIRTPYLETRHVQTPNPYGGGHYNAPVQEYVVKNTVDHEIIRLPMHQCQLNSVQCGYTKKIFYYVENSGYNQRLRMYNSAGALIYDQHTSITRIEAGYPYFLIFERTEGGRPYQTIISATGAVIEDGFNRNIGATQCPLHLCYYEYEDTFSNQDYVRIVNFAGSEFVHDESDNLERAYVGRNIALAAFEYGAVAGASPGVGNDTIVKAWNYNGQVLLDGTIRNVTNYRVFADQVAIRYEINGYEMQYRVRSNGEVVYHGADSMGYRYGYTGNVNLSPLERHRIQYGTNYHVHYRTRIGVPTYYPPIVIPTTPYGGLHFRVGIGGSWSGSF